MGRTPCSGARLRDPYTGKTTSFVRGVGTSLAVQVDHVVALAAAWRTGARRWTAERQLLYANDPAGLLAVDGPTNGSKSDQDAASETPVRPACTVFVEDSMKPKHLYTSCLRSQL